MGAVLPLPPPHHTTSPAERKSVLCWKAVLCWYCESCGCLARPGHPRPSLYIRVFLCGYRPASDTSVETQHPYVHRHHHIVQRWRSSDTAVFCHTVNSEGDTVDVLCEGCPGGGVAACSAHPQVDGGVGWGRSSGIRYHRRCHWNKRWQVRL